MTTPALLIQLPERRLVTDSSDLTISTDLRTFPHLWLLLLPHFFAAFITVTTVAHEPQIHTKGPKHYVCISYTCPALRKCKYKATILYKPSIHTILLVATH